MAWRVEVRNQKQDGCRARLELRIIAPDGAGVLITDQELTTAPAVGDMILVPDRYQIDGDEQENAQPWEVTAIDQSADRLVIDLGEFETDNELAIAIGPFVDWTFRPTDR